jgi:hypothetical protein
MSATQAPHHHRLAPISRRAQQVFPMHIQDHEAIVEANVSYTWCFHQLLISLWHVYDMGGNSLLILGIRETIAGVKNGNVVNILHVALLKIGRYAETLTQEVQGI